MKPWDYRRSQRRTTAQQNRQSGWLWVLAVLSLVILSVFLWNVVGAATENILDAFDKFTEWLNEA
jgi:HAMP domain-containing protein